MRGMFEVTRFTEMKTVGVKLNLTATPKARDFSQILQGANTFELNLGGLEEEKAQLLLTFYIKLCGALHRAAISYYCAMLGIMCIVLLLAIQIGSCRVWQ